MYVCICIKLEVVIYAIILVTGSEARALEVQGHQLEASLGLLRPYLNNNVRLVWHVAGDRC